MDCGHVYTSYSELAGLEMGSQIWESSLTRTPPKVHISASKDFKYTHWLVSSSLDYSKICGFRRS